LNNLKIFLSIGPICHTHKNKQGPKKRIRENINRPSQGKFNRKFKQKHENKKQGKMSWA
jgi:hypothetical protein